jgi:hypothetical protein
MQKFNLLVSFFLSITIFSLKAQTVSQDTLKPASKPDKDALKFNLNESGTHFFQVTFLNQTWLRYNQSNPGTTVQGNAQSETFDIGLRRTRIQMFGQITDKVFLYFQFGQNNFNSLYTNTANNRKFAAFFHDAVTEYKVTKGNQLKIGGGLTIVNGLSRFSQPSVSTIMTLDVPVFAQATVDQTDEFSRKLSLYARGQIWKIDYRVALSDPFPVSSNGSTPPAVSKNANFTPNGHTKQYQAYVMYQFFDHENHTTPGYMTGTYLGKKKVFNVAAGIIGQKDAMWYLDNNGDITYNKMLLWNIESFLDIPLNKDKKTALSAYVGYFNNNYGPNYIRYNGIMNPANGTALPSATLVGGNSWGNAFPMFGTGKVVYSQFGYLLPTMGEKKTQLMPYTTWMHASYDRLGHTMDVVDIGINYLIKGHNAKLTLDYQNRPTYSVNALDATRVDSGTRRGTLLLQYQIFI